MEPLQKLRQLIANATEQDHRIIYDFIEQQVLSPKSSIIKHVPPLDVIAYSITHLLSPSFAAHRIPDLLDLLATAEFYRGRTLDHARDAIIWNNYYKKSESTVITLTPREEAFLKSLESQKDSLRKVYITILTTCCHLDIYLLWTANPLSVTELLVRFNEYFPFLNKHCSKTSPRLFHTDLSPKEITELEHIALACCNLAQETIDWAVEHQGHNRPIHSAFQTEEFRITFQRPCNDDKLCLLINFFIGRVTSAAQRIQEIFGENHS